MPKISIVVPAYNAGKRLSITLQSLIEQKYKKFEVIIIDDGSTDNTKEIAEKFIERDTRFNYFYQENSGVSIARNNGIKKSKGKYISFLDADDYYDNYFLEKMYNEIEKTKAKVCFSGYKNKRSEGIENVKTNFSKKNTGLKYIQRRLTIHTNSWLIERQYINEFDIKFPPNVSWGEDFEFFTEILMNTDEITFVPEYLTYYVSDHSRNQLSAFSIDQIDKDYESIMRMVGSSKINKNKKIEKTLIDYRLHGYIVYKLLLAIKQDLDSQLIRKYYIKYKNYIQKPVFNNGARSIKLNLNKLYLIYLMSKN